MASSSFGVSTDRGDEYNSIIKVSTANCDLSHHLDTDCSGVWNYYLSMKIVSVAILKIFYPQPQGIISYDLALA
jgi:hypothetical protein